MKKSIFATILFFTLCEATIAGSYSGKVTPYFYHNGLYIQPAADNQKSSLPACATRPLLRLEDDPNSVVYKQKLAILLTAFYANRPVYLEGNGVCTSEGDEIIGVLIPQ